MTPQELVAPRIMWAALLSSVVVIVVVGFVAIAGVTSFQAVQWAHLLPSDPEQPSALIWGMSLLPLIASFVLPRVLKAKAPPPTSSSSTLQRALTPFILSMALAESCALSGFVAALFMGAPVPELMLLPAAATLFAGLTRFPTAASFRALASSG